jgi:hypothetical protein
MRDLHRYPDVMETCQNNFIDQALGIAYFAACLLMQPYNTIEAFIEISRASCSSGLEGHAHDDVGFQFNEAS